MTIRPEKNCPTTITVTASVLFLNSITRYKPIQPLPANPTSYDIAQFFQQFINWEKLLGQPGCPTPEFAVQAFREALRKLGDPHLRYPVIHVAGTKGKGSTCAMLESIFRAAGFKTGLYTSPHLLRYEERIRINGEEIESQQLGDALRVITATAPPADDSWRTVFELLTASAFLIFASARVDVAIIETGLGGRLDATNVFETAGSFPHVAAITTIAYDHMNLLGSTIESIASEKCGILRPHGAAILGLQTTPWADSVRRVFLEHAQHAGLFPVQQFETASAVLHTAAVASEGEELTTLEVVDPRLHRGAGALVIPSRIGLAGQHQVTNAATAVTAALAMNTMLGDHPITEKHIVDGLSAVRWPARFEVLQRQNPIVVVDGAHCPYSVAAVATTWQRHFPNVRPVVLLGTLRDKQTAAMAKAVTELLSPREVYVCAPATPRALPADEATQLLIDAGMPGHLVHTITSPTEAMHAALQRSPEALLCIGSLYLPGELSAAFASWRRGG